MHTGLMGVLAAAMESCQAFESEENQETQRYHRHNWRDRATNVEDLRQNVEQYDRDDSTGAEAKQQMQAVAQPNSRDSPETGRDEGKTREYYRHLSVPLAGSRYFDGLPM